MFSIFGELFFLRLIPPVCKSAFRYPGFLIPVKTIERWVYEPEENCLKNEAASGNSFDNKASTEDDGNIEDDFEDEGDSKTASVADLKSDTVSDSDSSFSFSSSVLVSCSPFSRNFFFNLNKIILDK